MMSTISKDAERAVAMYMESKQILKNQKKMERSIVDISGKMASTEADRRQYRQEARKLREEVVTITSEMCSNFSKLLGILGTQSEKGDDPSSGVPKYANSGGHAVGADPEEEVKFEDDDENFGLRKLDKARNTLSILDKILIWK